MSFVFSGRTEQRGVVLRCGHEVPTRQGQRFHRLGETYAVEPQARELEKGCVIVPVQRTGEREFQRLARTSTQSPQQALAVGLAAFEKVAELAQHALHRKQQRRAVVQRLGERALGKKELTGTVRWSRVGEFSCQACQTLQEFVPEAFAERRTR